MDLFSFLLSMVAIIGACWVLLKIAEYNFPRKSLRLDNLTDGTTDDDLRPLCESYGDVVVHKREDWDGYGFVHFREAADAARARIELNRLYLRGQVINVSWAYKDRYGNIAHPLYRLAEAVFWYVTQFVKNIVVGFCAFITRRLSQENEMDEVAHLIP